MNKKNIFKIFLATTLASLTFSNAINAMKNKKNLTTTNKLLKSNTINNSRKNNKNNFFKIVKPNKNLLSKKSNSTKNIRNDNFTINEPLEEKKQKIFKKPKFTIDLNKINNILNEKNETKNLNSINIINKELKKEDLEQKIIKTLNNAENFEKNCNFNTWLSILNNDYEKFLDVIKNLLDQKGEDNASEKCALFLKYYSEDLLFLQQYILELMNTLLEKENLTLNANNLKTLIKNKEYKNINYDLNIRLKSFLAKYYKNCALINKLINKIDNLFDNINILLIPDMYTDLNEKENKEKYNEEINKIINSELNLLENRESIIELTKIFVSEFYDFYKKYLKNNLNSIITLYYKTFLRYLSECLKLEKEYGETFQSFVNLIKNSLCPINPEKLNKINEAIIYFSEVKDAYEKLESIKNIMNLSKKTNSDISNDIDKIKNREIQKIENFFDFFQTTKMQNFKTFIKKNSNKITPEIIHRMKQMNSNLDLYSKNPIVQSYSDINSIKKNTSVLENFLETNKNKFQYVKDSIIRLDLEDKYEKNVEEIERLFNNCESILKNNKLFISTLNNLDNHSGIIFTTVDKLKPRIAEWNELAEQTLIPEKIKIDEKLNNINSNKEHNTGFNGELQHQIQNLEDILKKLKQYYKDNIANTNTYIKEDYIGEEKTKKQFNEIKSKYHEYYLFFKNTKEFFENLLNKNNL